MPISPQNPKSLPHSTIPHENQSPPPEIAPGPNSPQPPPNSIPWIVRQPLGLSHSFNLKLEQLSCEKVLNFVLLDNYFTDLFTEVQIQYRKTFKFGPERFLER